MRYIESIHAIFVKEQNKLLVFPLSYQTFFLFLGQQSKRDKEHINTITQKCNPFTISYVAMYNCNYTYCTCTLFHFKCQISKIIIQVSYQALLQSMEFITDKSHFSNLLFGGLLWYNNTTGEYKMPKIIPIRDLKNTTEVAWRIILRYATFVLCIIIFNINIQILPCNSAIFVDVMVCFVGLPANN